MTVMLAAVLSILPDMGRWNAEIGLWVDWLRAGGVAAGTASLRRYQVQRVSQDFPRRDPYGILPEDLGEWMASHGWANETLRSYRSAIRSFYGWAHASGRCESDPSRLLRKIPPGAAVPRPAADSVINAALAIADERTRLMLMLGSRQGLRRGEISRIHSDDLLPTGDGWSLLVHGKGGKDRVIPLLDSVAEDLRARPAGWAFPNGHGGPISPAHVGVLIRRAMPTATTHQLRHRFGSVTYQATGDIRAVQELLGHASVATTQRYTAVADGALRRVMQTAA